MKTDFFDVSKREARDAARLALQSAVAAAAMFSLMQALSLPEKFVGVLSAVLVVQPSVGNTLGEAWERIAATLVGSVIGILCLIILPGGYGTAAALALSMFVMNAAAGFRPEWRYGVVAAVALSLGSESEAMQTAQDRAIAIGIGVLVGALVSLIVWPDTATKRAQRHLSAALKATAKRLDTAVEGARGKSDAEADAARHRFHANLESAREAANGIRFGDADKVKAQIEHTERLYNSALILNRVAEDSDDAATGGEDFQDRVETIRRCGCEIAEALAEGDHDQEERLDKIETALEAARESVAESAKDPRQHVFKNALVFGLGEVYDSLRDLINAHRKESTKISL